MRLRERIERGSQRENKYRKYRKLIVLGFGFLLIVEIALCPWGVRMGKRKDY